MSAEGRDDGLAGVARKLGYAGLLPFCAAPLMMWGDPGHRSAYQQVLASYSLAIICFLVGVWWGLSLIRRSPRALVLSNVVVIVAFLGHAMWLEKGFFLLCALLFPAILLVERRAGLFQAQPAYYARLRVQLSAVATVGLLLAYAQS
jgi:hypothetical protein